MQAFDNPVFIEDMVSDVAVRLDQDRRVAAYRVEARNQESIHNHDAFAAISSGMCPESSPSRGARCLLFLLGEQTGHPPPHAGQKGLASHQSQRGLVLQGNRPVFAAVVMSPQMPAKRVAVAWFVARSMLRVTFPLPM